MSTMHPVHTLLRAIRSILLNSYRVNTVVYEILVGLFFVDQLNVGKRVLKIVTLVLEYGSVALLSSDN